MKWKILAEADEEVANAAEDEVVFAVEEEPDGSKQAIVADISRDEAWIAAPVEDARTLTQWR